MHDVGTWAASVLLLADATVLAVIVITAVFALTVVALGLGALVLLARGPEANTAPRRANAETPHSLAIRASAGRSAPGLRGVEIDVPTKHVDRVISALRASGWSVRETGEVVATDEDEEGLTTISVDLPPLRGSGEEIR